MKSRKQDASLLVKFRQEEKDFILQAVVKKRAEIRKDLGARISFGSVLRQLGLNWAAEVLGKKAP